MPADAFLKRHESSHRISMNDNHNGDGDGNSIGGDDGGVCRRFDVSLVVASRTVWLM